MGLSASPRRCPSANRALLTYCPDNLRNVARSHESLWLAAAGIFTAVAVALLGANVTLDAVRPHYVFWTSGLIITAYVAGLLAMVCFTGAMRQWSVPLAGDRPHRGSPAEPIDSEVPAETTVNTPGPVVTDRWRHTSDGGKVPALMSLTHVTMFHPGCGGRQPQDPSPSVKIGVLVACQPINPARSGTELRANFLAFLESEPMRNLIAALTSVPPDSSWKSLAGNGPRTMEAALTTGQDALGGVPLASALLLPPVAGESLYGRNSESATLIIYTEPRAADGQTPSASDPAAWEQRFELALAMPGAFAQFLAKDLDLDTSDDPPAQLGVWLQSYGPLTVMVDTRGLKTLPGSSPSNWYTGWAFAAPDGKSGQQTARDFLIQLCEYDLHLDGFEQTLDGADSTQPAATAQVNDTWQSRDLRVLTTIVRLLDETREPQIRVQDVAKACGLSADEVASAVRALDGEHIHLQTTVGQVGSWLVSRPTAAARRLVGQWPAQ